MRARRVACSRWRFVVFATLAAAGCVGRASAADCPVVAISSSAGLHNLALDADGHVLAWGYAGSGEIGDGRQPTRLIEPRAQRPLGLPPVVAVAANREYSLALDLDGTVWSWGRNHTGQLGDGTKLDRNVPAPILTGMSAIAAGKWHGLAVGRDGRVWAWGRNDEGELGDGTLTERLLPVEVVGLVDVVEVAGGAYFSLARTADGRVWAWGDNHTGVIGREPAQGVFTTPVEVVSLGPALMISAALETALAVKPGGTVWVWGKNYNGEHGNDTWPAVGYSSTPVQALGLQDIEEVGASDVWLIARRRDGAIWVWGLDPPGLPWWPVPRTVPIQFTVAPPAAAVSAGIQHALMLDFSGVVWGWGNGSSGQLGPLAEPRSAVAITIDIDPPAADQGNTLLASRSGDDVVLDYPSAPASVWQITRDDDPARLGTTPLLPEPVLRRHVDAGAVRLAPPLLFYRLRGLSTCSLTPGP